jgi:hypothetical protein
VSVSGFGPTSSFLSCPAATGEAENSIGGCGQFRDGAHRCGEDRGGHDRHCCTCGVEWTCSPPGALSPDPLDAEFPASYFHAPQHLAPEATE